MIQINQTQGLPRIFMDVLIPNLGDIDEVEVIEITVSPGDQVQENDGLIVIESDKASMEGVRRLHGVSASKLPRRQFKKAPKEPPQEIIHGRGQRDPKEQAQESFYSQRTQPKKASQKPTQEIFT